MSDNTSNGAGDQSDDNGSISTEPEGKEETLEFWKTEALEARKRRDDAAKRARLLAKENEELKGSKSKDDKDNAEKSGDIARLRTEFQKDLETKDSEIEGLRTKLKKAVVESKFRSVASEFFVPQAIDDLWQLTENDFDLEEDEDGRTVPIVRNQVDSFESYLKKLADKKPHFAKNPKKSGVGASGPGDRSKGANADLEKLKGMTAEEQKAILASNPELRSLAFRAMKF